MINLPGLLKIVHLACLTLWPAYAVITGVAWLQLGLVWVMMWGGYSLYLWLWRNETRKEKGEPQEIER